MLVLQLRSDTDLPSNTLSLQGQRTQASLQNWLFFFLLKEPKKKESKNKQEWFHNFLLATVVFSCFYCHIVIWHFCFQNELVILKLPCRKFQFGITCCKVNMLVCFVWWNSWGNSLTFLVEPLSWGRVNTVVSGLPMTPHEDSNQELLTCQESVNYSQDKNQPAKPRPYSYTYFPLIISWKLTTKWFDIVLDI